jgi:hypothetical protein
MFQSTIRPLEFRSNQEKPEKQKFLSYSINFDLNKPIERFIRGKVNLVPTLWLITFIAANVVTTFPIHELFYVARSIQYS